MRYLIPLLLLTLTACGSLKAAGDVKAALPPSLPPAATPEDVQAVGDVLAEKVEAVEVAISEDVAEVSSVAHEALAAATNAAVTAATHGGDPLSSGGAAAGFVLVAALLDRLRKKWIAQPPPE